MQSLPYRFLDHFQLMQNFIIPKSKDFKPSSFKVRCTTAVFLLKLGMLATIHLYNQFRFQANEVQDVVSKRMLPTKLLAVHLTSTQISPQQLFRLSHIISQNTLQFIFEDLLVCLAFHVSDPIPIVHTRRGA
jgi:hypothetical protein